MTKWEPDLTGQSGPKYRQIADTIGASVTSGSLVAGDRLPPQRDLADRLGVSLNTVSRAYAEAARRGFLQGEVGRGTYIRLPSPTAAETPPATLARPAQGLIDLTLNLPVAGESAAKLAETLASLHHSTELASLLDYQTGGDPSRRTEAAAAWISRLGLDVSGDDLVLTNGAQHGLLVSMLAVLRPGDVLLTESLTYAPVKTLATHLGLRLFPVAMDEGGLSPDALDAACRSTSARTLYCLPTLHTPTTITMSAKRRKEIAEVAGRHGLLIIEDDVFGFLPDERPPPLSYFAPESTIFITSASKCMAPGLRVGFVHAPGRLGHALRAAVNLSCWMPPPLMAEIVSLWIRDGTADRLNEYQRTEARARQRAARRILTGSDLLADPSGFHVWLSLPDHWHADGFRAVAERRGVKVLTGGSFAVAGSEPPSAVRLCLSHEPSRERVERGLEIIAALLPETDGSSGLIV